MQPIAFARNALSPERLATVATNRPWTVIGVWIIALVAGLAAATTIGSVLTTAAENFVDTESRDANRLLEARIAGTDAGTETIVIQSESRTTADPAYRALVERLTADLRALTGDVASAVNTFEAPTAVPVSADGRTTIIPITLKVPELDADKHVAGIEKLLHDLDGKDGFTVVAIGDGTTSRAFTELSEKDLQTAEIYGIPIAMVILALVFGALVAAGLPLLLGLFSIVIAIGLSAMAGRAFELSLFLVNFVTTMGLAVGIDYALVYIKRVREERGKGLESRAAIRRAGGTAGRAVLFSGMAVVVALCGMLLVPNNIFRSLGFGAILVVAVAVTGALTLLPAVLTLLGDRVDRLRLRIPFTSGDGEGFWRRVTSIVMERPVISVVVSAALLLAAAVPYATIRLGWNGVSTLPAETDARQAYEILDREFSAGLVAPARIVVDVADPASPAIKAAVERLAASTAGDTRFGPISATEGPGLLILEMPLDGDPQGNRAQSAIDDLRGSLLPAAFAGTGARPLVTGMTAEGMDDTGIIDSYTLPVFAFVLGLSFIILLVVFRSIVVPLKAMVMNLLSVGAAYGLMVLVFQHGIGNEIFGFTQVERIESWVPLFMFAVLFGLSMDYHVFLLSRIREHYLQTGDNRESVAFGVASTAGLITGAAAIMIAVFAGFAAGDMVAFQQMGFGLAVAVLLDATIVRSVLVPASMELLGNRNWYLPRWLNWLPQVDVEGATSHAPEAPVRPVPGALAGGFAGE